MAVRTSPAPEISHDVLSTIEEHVRARPERSTGGLLVGRRGAEGVRVVAAIPDPNAEEYHGDIEFSAAVWRDAYARIGDEFAGAQLVGWYHSHPDARTSLTDYDRSFHRAMFSEPETVALVLAPTGGTRAWYGWVLGHLAEASAAADVIDLSGVPARRRWTSVAVAVALVAAAAGGFAAGAVVRHPTGQVSSSGRAEEARLRATIDPLRSRLAETERERRALEARLSATQAAERKERRRAETATRRPRFVRYRVRQGYTLWQLAISFYGNPAAWSRIAKANGIIHPGHLEVGQVLRIRLA